jgi:two-component system sensor histidine kinase DesK
VSTTSEPARDLRAGQRWDGRGARMGGLVFTGVWLLYLIQPIADLITKHYGVLYEAGGLAILVAFCVLYLLLVPSWPAAPRYTLPGLAALTLLAVVGCLFYGQEGGVALWIFLSSAAGLLVASRRWAACAVLAYVACYCLFSATTHQNRANFLSNLIPVTFIGFAMIAMRQHFLLTAELRRAREEVAQLAASEERLRLARDMHDLTGQSLSTITLKSELAVRLLGRLPESADRERAVGEMEQVAVVSRQTLKDIREAISGYRRPTLAVEIITARAALASAGMTVSDDADLTLLSGTFDPDAEAALAWCLREAVTNVVRHSGARNCRLSLTRRGRGTLALTVTDDGSGCGAGPRAPEIPGSGLRGMSERLSAVGGSLELQPDLQPGFCLVAAVPAVPAVPARADHAAAAR